MRSMLAATAGIRRATQVGARLCTPGQTVPLAFGSTTRYNTGWKAGDDSSEVDGVLDVSDLPAL